MHKVFARKNAFYLMALRLIIDNETFSMRFLRFDVDLPSEIIQIAQIL